MLFKLLGRPENIVSVSSRYLAAELPEYAEMLLGDRAINACFDNSRIKAAVPEFRTCIGLEDGMRDAIEYYKANDYLQGIDYWFDARVDRMIATFLERQAGSRATCLGFVDYLRQGDVRACLGYQLCRHADVRRFPRLGRLARILLDSARRRPIRRARE
jgi:hypothetical protein